MNTAKDNQNRGSVDSQVRHAIVRSYRRGVYDSRIIAESLNSEMASQPATRSLRVDAALIREVRRRERAAIESDLAAVLADPAADLTSGAFTPTGATRFGVIYCLSAARERLRLALWVDRLTPEAA